MAQVQWTYTDQNISFLHLLSLSLLLKTLMADRGALPLLTPSLPRPSIFLSFSSLRPWQLQKPSSSPSSVSHPLYSSSSRSTVVSVKVISLNRRRFRYKVCAVAEEEGRHGRTEREKRGRKRRQLWEELLEDNFEDDDDVDVGDSGKIDLWKILEEIVDNVWILKVPHLCVGCLN